MLIIYLELKAEPCLDWKLCLWHPGWTKKYQNLRKCRWRIKISVQKSSWTVQWRRSVSEMQILPWNWAREWNNSLLFSAAESPFLGAIWFPAFSKGNFIHLIFPGFCLQVTDGLTNVQLITRARVTLAISSAACKGCFGEFQEKNGHFWGVSWEKWALFGSLMRKMGIFGGLSQEKMAFWGISGEKWVFFLIAWEKWAF